MKPEPETRGGSTDKLADAPGRHLLLVHPRQLAELEALSTGRRKRIWRQLLDGLTWWITVLPFVGAALGIAAITMLVSPSLDRLLIAHADLAMPRWLLEAMVVGVSAGVLFYIVMLLQRCYLRRELRRVLLPACPACGYDLTGNTSGVCPECGRVPCPTCGYNLTGNTGLVCPECGRETPRQSRGNCGTRIDARE